VEVFGPRTDADETRGQLSQNWEPSQQAHYKRQRPFVAGHSTGNDSAMNKYLHPLDQSRRPFAPQLDLSQIVYRHGTASQFHCEQIRRRDGILNREINSNAACR
jgi:hypothetical protein